MNTLDPTLREHAERLLVGTDLTVDDLLVVATGALPASTPAASAVRDGWNAAAPLSEPVSQP
ncbi:hypothetical protein GA707_18570 [Nostocoides sp. F2B08]|uniref:hypothetical protein n=1 Tax=Nostocoides sp. F2B08 TaxID=2653936 RepID=UPI0012630F33|nr:hypothetical protein [Tetrasphaera sp. F2B08]KAB7740905.1 hypothetical protein GA707_18570 [Tetrasphaera sp. F2B08]